MTTATIYVHGPASRCPAGCTRHGKSLHAFWDRQHHMREVAATLLAATRTRCGCGSTGDWSRSVSGTSGTQKCVWAGCGTCRGAALGAPVLLSELRGWQRLSPGEQAQRLGEAIAAEDEYRHHYIAIDMDTLGSTIDYEWSHG